MHMTKLKIVAILAWIAFDSSMLFSQDLTKKLLLLDKAANGVEINQSIDYDSLYFAKYYAEKDWFEWFKVVCVKSNTVIWSAEPDSAIRNSLGMRILKGTIIRLQNYACPILEIYDASHRGNGSFRLFTIQNQTLNSVFAEEHAVDADYEMTGFYQDSSQVFKNGYLKSFYQDINSDGFLDLVLRDTIIFYKGDEIKEIKAIGMLPCERRFIWDSKKQTFIKSSSSD